MPNGYLRNDTTPTQLIAAPQIELAGDMIVRPAVASDGVPQLIVRDRGIMAGMIDGVVRPRRLSVTDPAYYVAGNMYQSIMNAYNALKESWNGGSDGYNVYGEIEVPPGVHTLSDELVFASAGNVAIVGVGTSGDTDSQGGINLGGGMTQLVVPAVAGKWGMKFVKGTGPGRVAAGPRVENIQLVGNATCAGGFKFEAQNSARLINCATSNFTTGTGLKLGAAGYQSQYNYVECFTDAGSKFGIDTTDAADATFVHCMLMGNRSGNTAVTNYPSAGKRIVSGSIGFREGTGSNRSIGLLIQGYDRLLQNDTSGCSVHYGLRLEDFGSYGVYIGGAIDANVGGQYFIQSCNNSLEGGIGTGIYLASGATSNLIVSMHVQAVATRLNDASGGDTNIANINGQHYFGSFNMNGASGVLQLWRKAYAADGFGSPIDGTTTPNSRIGRMAVYNSSGSHVGWVAVESP